MDGVSIASSIAGLISLAIQVTDTITQYVRAVKDYKKNAQDLRDELGLLTNVLGRLKDFLQSEGGQNLALEGSVLPTAIADCTRRVERIAEKIKPSGASKLARAWDKATWAFEQKDVLQLVDGLKRYIHTFEFALTIENCTLLSKASDDINKGLSDMLEETRKVSESVRLLPDLAAYAQKRTSQLEDVLSLMSELMQQGSDIKKLSHASKVVEEREQRRLKTEILDWLTPESSLKKHRDVQDIRIPGTGQWFLGLEKFMNWAEGRSSQQDLLCLGGPGRGKTFLCSTVIDFLRCRHKDNPKIVVAHYYCDISMRQAQTSRHLARCMLRQLCQDCKIIPAAVSQFYKENRDKEMDLLWFQKLQRVLQRVIAIYDQCFIVLDALDETETARDQRRKILEILDMMRIPDGRTKVFATTRPDTEIECAFHSVDKIEVNAHETDVQHFLSKRIDRKIEERPRSRNIIDDALRKEIILQLSSHADGMFLLPALHIENILNQETKGDVRRALSSVSTTLDGVFGKTIERIHNLSDSLARIASLALMWVCYARRHLTVSELEHAVAFRADWQEIVVDDIPPIEVILRSCCGLIKVDGADDASTSSVRFVHTSLHEYLRYTNHGLFNDGERAIVRTCLQYLSLEALKPLADMNRNSFNRSMTEFVLLEYAASYWGFHAQALNVSAYGELALALFKDGRKLFVIARIRDLGNEDFRKWKEKTAAWAHSEGGGGGTSLAARFGLADLMRLIVGQYAEPYLLARDMYGNTPLHICAMHGYEDAAEVLISHRASLSELTKANSTPFYLAVSYEQLSMCQTLLKYDRGQLHNHCKEGYTALHKASDLGNETMVRFLLQSGASPDAVDLEGMTALHLASRKGYIEIVKMLVLAESSVLWRSKDGHAPLDLAAHGGHLAVVTHLLAWGADVASRSKYGRTALHRSAKSGHTDIVMILLDKGSDLFASDNAGRIPLIEAARSGNVTTVKTVLDFKSELRLPQLHHRDRKGDTAKTVAFYCARYNIHKHLRDVEYDILGLDPIFNPGPDPTVPLTHAIEQNRSLEVIAILKSQPELLTLADSQGQTPLHIAFLESQKDIAEYILQQGVSINIPGYHQWTPLHIAASLGSIRMVQLALDYGADIHALTVTEQTTLHKAASARSVPVLRELLLCGCDPATQNDVGMTAIHVAAGSNFIDGVREMLLHESKRPERRKLVLLRDKQRRTPRQWAYFCGHLEMSAFLRGEEGIAVGKPSDQNTPVLSRVSTTLENMSLSRQTTLVEASQRGTGLSLLSPQSTNVSFRTQQGREDLLDEDEYNVRAGASSPYQEASSPGFSTPTPTPKHGSPMMEME